MYRPTALYPRARRRGVALITTLILLVMLTVVAVSAARMANLEERMAGNMRDRDIALRAAEMALRDAERDLLQTVPAAARDLTVFNTACKTNNSTAFTIGCGNGLCYNGTTGYVWSTDNDKMTAAPSVAYGTYTNATAISGVSAQPRYLIECVPRFDALYYRIIVRAPGAKPGTAVMLEELFGITDAVPR